MDRELLSQRLYRVFRLKDEDYSVTIKLLYIYDWVAPQAGDITFDVIAALRKEFPHRSNQINVDEFYRAVKTISLLNSGRYDTNATNAPASRERIQSGWRPW